MESVLNEPIEKEEVVAAAAGEATVETTTNATPQAAASTETPEASSTPAADDSTYDDDVDFGQVPSTGNDKSTSSPDAALEALKAQLNEATTTITALQAQVASFESLAGDPLVKLWNEYRMAEGDSHSVGGFFKKVGAVSPVDGQDDEALVRMHFERQASELGLQGDEFAQAVEEEVYSWVNEPSTLKRKSLVSSAKKALSGNANASLEAIEKDYKTKRDTEQRMQMEWLDRQRTKIHAGIENVIGKRFNGRIVNSEWATKVKSAIERSGDIFNPDFVRYTAPDANGVSDLLVEDVVRFIDTAIHREELFNLSKKTIGRARAENLEAKAVQAHNTSIAREVQSGKTITEEDAAYERAMQRQNPNFKL
jgi:hypothetical protein